MKKVLLALLLSPALLFGQATGTAISNKPIGGSIGTAATTVDVSSKFNVNQTTAGQTLTIPNPTNRASGPTIYVRDTGTVSFTLVPGGVINVGSGATLGWTGNSWNVVGSNGGSSITFGTGVETALGVNIGSAGAPILFNGAAGTPSSITLTNGTGLPLTTGVTGILPIANGGTNASSASITAFNNITGYTASGATGTTSTNLVFSTSPNLTTPTIGVASATSLAITGTANAGFVEMIAQSSNTSAPSASGFRLFAGSTGSFNWVRKNGSDTYVRTFDATLTADRTYTLPDATGNILVYSQDSIVTGASGVVNWNATHSYTTLSANTTFSFSNAADAKTIVVRVKNTVSNYTVTWPTVKWTGGVVPTQTTGAKTDIYTFIRINGIVYGSYIQDMY